MATSRRHADRGRAAAGSRPEHGGYEQSAGGSERPAGRPEPSASDGGGLGRAPIRRLPPVRLAPRDELAAAARVVPLLRAARDLARWARQRDPGRGPGPSRGPGHGPGPVAGRGHEARASVPDPEWPVPLGPAAQPISAALTAAAAAELDLTPAEADAAWRVAEATRMLEPERDLEFVEAGGGADALRPEGVLASGDTEDVLTLWDQALEAILRAEDLDGLATALYTVAGPVRMDGLFDAYAAAAGSTPGRGGSGQGSDHTADVSRALETLADLGVVELGTEDPAGALTVALSPLGVWGVHRRLRAQGWHVPVLGEGRRDGAAGLLMTLASCDAEDGEAEIAAWLGARTLARAAAELIGAARTGSPGRRGAAFAVLDRIGADAVPDVTAALAEPVLRAHAAVWLHEHGEDAELRPEDRTWLLVDLGAGLLEEADPRDVVAELLPDVTPAAQAEIVAGLWQVRHPGVTGLLTALSDHHPDPAVARAARKAAFKARSPSASIRPRHP